MRLGREEIGGDSCYGSAFHLRLGSRPRLAVGLGIAAGALAADHFIRENLPTAIASYGTPNGMSLLGEVKQRLDLHPHVGPGAAFDAAASAVALHPDLRSKAEAVMGSPSLSTVTLDDKVAQKTAALPIQATAIDVARNGRQNCPPPTAAAEAMSARAAAYQMQVTGLPAGQVIMLGGVKFDRCREADNTMLEAKGPGYAQFLVSATERREWYGGDGGVFAQAISQSNAVSAAGKKSEWHFAEKLASDRCNEAS